MNIETRHFRDTDAADISIIIRRNLREVNSKDYPSELIETLVRLHRP